MEAQAVINQVELAGAFLNQDMAALAVGIVDQQVEKHHRAQAFQISWFKIEIMIVGVMVNILLKRAETERAIPQERERHHTEAQRLADQIGAHFPSSQAVPGEVPQRLFPAGWLIDGRDFTARVTDIYQEGIVIATRKLTLEFDLTVGKNSLGTIGRNCHNFSACGRSSLGRNDLRVPSADRTADRWAVRA